MRGGSLIPALTSFLVGDNNLGVTEKEQSYSCVHFVLINSAHRRFLRGDGVNE